MPINVTTIAVAAVTDASAFIIDAADAAASLPHWRLVV